MKRKQVNAILFDQAKRKKKIFDYSCVIVILSFLAIMFFYLYAFLSRPEYVSYTENSNLDYKVYLKDNVFFKDEYLKSDNQYIAGLIDFVRADFSYNMKANKDVNFKYSYSIVANVNVIDKSTHKSLYQYSEDLVTKNQIDFNDKSTIRLDKTIDIDYNKYNDLIKRFVGAYGLDNVESTLDVSMYVNVSGECDVVSNKNKDSVISLSIPLTTKTVAIDMAYNVVDSDSEKIMVCENDNVANISLLVVGGLLVLIIIRYIYVLIRYILVTRTAESIYDKELKKILNNYKSYIQKVENDIDFSGYKVLKIETFEDMLEIRDTVQEPILMVENKNKTGVSFYIPGKTKLIYSYSLKVSDIKFKLATQEEKK